MSLRRKVSLTLAHTNNLHILIKASFFFFPSLSLSLSFNFQNKINALRPDTRGNRGALRRRGGPAGDRGHGRRSRDDDDDARACFPAGDRDPVREGARDDRLPGDATNAVKSSVV